MLPSDNAVVFGEETLYVNPKRERNLDWLYELEEYNSKFNNVPSQTTDTVDVCCCPFIKITYKAFKSKK